MDDLTDSILKEHLKEAREQFDIGRWKGAFRAEGGVKASL